MPMLSLIAAQVAASVVLQPCNVFAKPAVDGQPAIIIADCNGRGFILGSADSYRVQSNEELDATIVELRQGAGKRILMLSYRKGQPLLEDITGSLAISAGRGVMSGLDGLEIDFTTFAQDGDIVVHPAIADPSKADKSATVNLGLQIEAEQSRVITASTPN